MSNNSNLGFFLEKISASLNDAARTLELRASISEKILKIAHTIETSTNNALIVIEKEAGFNGFINGFASSNNLICVNNRNYGNSRSEIILFGYSVNSQSVYPIILETAEKEISAETETELNIAVTDIIVSKSIKIMELLNLSTNQDQDQDQDQDQEIN